MYLDEQTILYPAGSNAILYNTENKTQRFIPATEKSEGMTAMTVGGNKRFVAIAERGEKPVCIVYDLHTLRRRKTLAMPDVEAKEFISVGFSADSKFLVTQTGAPDWMLHYWSWEKSKTFASGNAKDNKENLLGAVVYQVSINPTDSTQICCIGNGIFKIFRYQEGVLKTVGVQKFDYKNFTAHTWTPDDRIIAGTEDGKIYVFESNGELKAEIQHTHGANMVPRAIYCVAAFSKGFVVGCAGGMAAISQGQSNSQREMYRKSREYTLLDENVRITNMAVSPSEDTLLCTTDNCQINSISLANAEVQEEARFDSFAQPFHHNQITGMDTCIRKPLIVTCSSDRSIRVWNYLETTSELVKYFPEEAFSVAMHPSGLYILVGFSDKLRLMNLLIDDIRPFREFTIRGCRECRFSNGGQYFAAVHGNTIQIYSTWNFDNLGNLKGHNGKVRSIYWTADDSKIISAGVDGAIYDWSLRDLSGHAREGESILKSCSYSCACATPDGKTILPLEATRPSRKIIDSQIVRELESDCVLTQVALSHSGRMMFVGMHACAADACLCNSNAR
ncbi:WD40-repeat-containing domain protein [Entophlyctis helioformis]|nr:WD40-repeat-containing domain protein [Entophlyctis helioformis]